MNQTIYFRKEVWESFKDEERKSELVNKLLLDHYDGPVQKTARAAVQPQAPQTFTAEYPIKTKDDAVEAVKQLFRDAEVVIPLYRDKKNKKL